MLIVRGVASDAVDYYLHGREAMQPGQWWGKGCAALGLAGEVAPGDLRRVMQGRNPASGRYLPSYRPARRRAGWDLIFSAPKSVSLLWALQPDGEAVAASHGAAVDGVMRHIEAEMLTIRQGGNERARGAVAAIFGHGTNAASEPHLHTHVLLANLGQGEDGHWAAVSGSQWRVCRQGLFALYQLELRHRLRGQGIDLPWRIRPDGTADLADVPRAAIRAASTQRWSAATIGRFETRRRATPQPWRQRSAEGGFAPEDAHRLGRRGQTAALPVPEPIAGRVSEWLLDHGSEFRSADVWTALAACEPRGMTAALAVGWSGEFCRDSIEVATRRSTPRWTTAMARRADERLLRETSWQPAVGNAGADLAASIARDRRLEPGPARALHALATSARPVEIVSAPAGVSGLLERAELVGAAVATWQRAGLTVAISCRHLTDTVRWQTLTGIESARAGRGTDVLVVDQADRRTTGELVPLFARAGASRGRIVLIEGGTLPRLTDPVSRAVVEMAAAQPVVALTAAGVAARLEPMRQLVAAWARRGPSDALLVGLGPDEVEGLAHLARSALREAGVLTGQEVTAAGRGFQPGDRVVSLRAGPLLPGRSTLGTVTALRDRPAQIEVSWDTGTRSVIAGPDQRHLGYGYAATPALAARTSAPLFLLGPGSAVPAIRERVIGSVRSGAGLELGAARIGPEVRAWDRAALAL